LSDITEKVREANFKSPAVIIIGEVVKLREKLAWIEKKPLFGRRVLVTRARSQASELVDLIDDMGGEAVEFPVIRLQPPSRPEAIQALDLALDKLHEFDWVLLTSVNGVEYFFRRLREKGIDVRKMGKARIAAVGPKTAEALAERGIIADVLPAKYQGEGILEAIQADLKAGQKVLLPTADLARDYLPGKLKELGLEVTEVGVYENVLITDDGDEIIHLLQNQSIHIITFTSSSTVTNLLEALRQLGVEDPLSLLQGVEIACIGPKTAETASQCGLPVTYMAEEATVASLVQSITQSK
jgi:uroporphyrinogen III methyltransferase / synthase